MTAFFVSRCLTFGLPREGENGKPEKKKDAKFDEKEYQRYEDIRSKLNFIFEEPAEIYKSKIQVAVPDEVRRIIFLSLIQFSILARLCRNCL